MSAPLSATAANAAAAAHAPAAVSAGVAAAAAKDALVLKVMRLSRPSLVSTIPIPLELDGPNADGELEALAYSIGTTEFLSLPQNKGNLVYLGETFAALISVHNEGDQNVRDLSIKAELQTPTQRVVLVDTSKSALALMKPNDSVDALMSHDVKELGMHVLFCSINYVTGTGERRFPDAKRFSFKVQPPLAIKTKVHSQKTTVFLEAQMHNVTANVMFVKSVKFDPAPMYVCEDMNVMKLPDGTTQSTFAATGTLCPENIRQYLFKLTPKPGEEKNAMKSQAIGKIEVIWRTNMGETGRIQTSQLPRKLPVVEELAVSSCILPETVHLNQKFIATLTLQNNSDRKMSLRLHSVALKKTDLLVVGVSGQHIGDIIPDGTRNIDIPLICTCIGLHSLGGLRAVDLISGKNYEFDNVADVFVEN